MTHDDWADIIAKARQAAVDMAKELQQRDDGFTTEDLVNVADARRSAPEAMTARFDALLESVLNDLETRASRSPGPSVTDVLNMVEQGAPAEVKEKVRVAYAAVSGWLGAAPAADRQPEAPREN